MRVAGLKKTKLKLTGLEYLKMPGEDLVKVYLPEGSDSPNRIFSIVLSEER